MSASLVGSEMCIRDRWYTGEVVFPQTPEGSPLYIPQTPEDSPPPTPPGLPYPDTPVDSPPDESTMDVVEIIEPLEPNISNSLSPIQPTNSISPESRRIRNEYDETLNRIYDRLRQ